MVPQVGMVGASFRTTGARKWFQASCVGSERAQTLNLASLSVQTACWKSILRVCVSKISDNHDNLASRVTLAYQSEGGYF